MASAYLPVVLGVLNLPIYQSEPVPIQPTHQWTSRVTDVGLLAKNGVHLDDTRSNAIYGLVTWSGGLLDLPQPPTQPVFGRMVDPRSIFLDTQALSNSLNADLPALEPHTTASD